MKLCLQKLIIYSRLQCPTESEAYVCPCYFFQMWGSDIVYTPNSEKIEVIHFCGHWCIHACMLLAQRFLCKMSFWTIQFLKMQMKSVFVSQLLLKAILIVLLNLELDEWLFATDSDSERFTCNAIWCMCKTSTLVCKDLFSVWPSSFQRPFPYEIE